MYNICIELKTWWQMEELLIMSNFSICQSVFKSRLYASKCIYKWERVKNECELGSNMAECEGKTNAEKRKVQFHTSIVGLRNEKDQTRLAEG